MATTTTPLYLGLVDGLGVLSLLEVELPGVVSPVDPELAVEPADEGAGRTGILPVLPALNCTPEPTRGDSDLKKRKINLKLKDTSYLEHRMPTTP